MEEEKKTNFIETYENKMKFIRNIYKRNIYSQNGSNMDFILVTTFGVLSVVFTILILYILEFTMIGYVIAFIVLLILTLIHCYFSVKLMNAKSRYLYACKKRGYKNIEEYEDDLSLYITGPNGVYTELLEELKEDNKITSESSTITDINEIEYYIWKEKDVINILSTNTEEKPLIKTYTEEDIRYYRVDMNCNYVVVKTSTDEYHFTIDSANLIKKLLPGKDFNSIKNYHPEDYINDFELYMHAYKKEYDNKNETYKDYLVNSLILSISFLVIYFILGILNNAFDNFHIFLGIITCIVVVMLFNKLRKLVRYRVLMYNDQDVIYEINNDNEVLNHFNELKVALRIKDSYDTIVSTGGYPYIVWVEKDYFHLFLDIAYYNVVYIVLGLKNDIKYKVKNGETIIKLKDKSFHFEKNAAIVFDKLLNDSKTTKK